MGCESVTGSPCLSPPSASSHADTPGPAARPPAEVREVGGTRGWRQPEEVEVEVRTTFKTEKKVLRGKDRTQL